mmetsp:Transcript_65834/g.174573  ORF Transcript_65834/g.174573 Transcript_65834/m.174573 type:complete len:236 (-) Transcript_65834:961-1668(-)
MQPQDQMSRLELTLSVTSAFARVAESVLGAGSKPARPRSATTTCGEAKSEVDRRILSSRKSPWTTRRGRASWQCRKTSKVCRTTSASQLSLRPRMAEGSCRKAINSIPSTNSAMMYTLLKSSKCSTMRGMCGCSKVRSNSTSTRTWSTDACTRSFLVCRQARSSRVSRLRHLYVLPSAPRDRNSKSAYRAFNRGVPLCSVLRSRKNASGACMSRRVRKAMMTSSQNSSAAMEPEP